MPAFSKIEKETRKPPAMVQVPASAWAPSWKDAPLDPVLVGLRPLSEQDLVFCNGEAVKHAFRFYPTSLDEGVATARDAAYHDLQMRLAVSRATCDPNDVTQPWEVWGRHGGDELVREVLTTEGVKFLWDHLERVTIETSPVEPQATDEDIQELLKKAPGALAAMPHWRAARVRRLLHFCLNQTLAALGEVTDG
jgi:hypothetical protein